MKTHFSKPGSRNGTAFAIFRPAFLIAAILFISAVLAAPATAAVEGSAPAEPAAAGISSPADPGAAAASAPAAKVPAEVPVPSGKSEVEASGTPAPALPGPVTAPPMLSQRGDAIRVAMEGFLDTIRGGNLMEAGTRLKKTEEVMAGTHLEKIPAIILAAFRDGPAGAGKELEKAPADGQRDERILLLALILADNGFIEKAIEVLGSLKDSFSSSENRARGLVMLGSLNLDIGKRDEAEKCGLDALRVDGKSTEVKQFLADVSYQCGKFDKAKELFLALEAQLGSAAVNDQIITCDFESGNYLEAIERINNVVKDDPTNFSIMAMKALCILKSGDKEGGLKEIADLAASHPESDELKCHHVSLTLMADDPVSALKLAEKYFESVPTSFIVACKLAEVLLKTGNFDRAKEVAEKAMKINPKLPDSYMLLYDISVEMGNPAGGKAYIEQAYLSVGDEFKHIVKSLLDSIKAR